MTVLSPAVLKSNRNIDRSLGSVLVVVGAGFSIDCGIVNESNEALTKRAIRPRRLRVDEVDTQSL